MNEQPEALRLAGVLEALNAAKKLLPCVGGETLGTEVYRIRLSGSDAGELLDAAAELRRLYEEHIEEQGVIKVWRRRTLQAEEQRDELLEALKLAQSIIGHPEDAHSKLISAAIAKAEGVKP